MPSQIVGYSGFSSSNYIREPYSADLDFGTGEWNIGAWVNIPSPNTTAGIIASRYFSSTTPYITLGIDATNKLTATAFDGTTTRTVTTTAAYNTATWIKAEANYRAGRLSILVNGQEVAVTNGAPLLSLTTGRNMLTYSQNFENSVWDKTYLSGTISNDVIVSPDNTLTGDKIFPSTTNTGHALFSQNINFVNSTTYTFSLYVKSAGYNFWQFTTGLTTDYINFNLTTMSVGNNTSFFAGSMTDVGNGWYRCKIVFTSNLTSSQSIRIIPLDSDRASKSPSYAGDGTSGIYIWGAQLEQASSATDYIATNIAPLTIGNSYDLTAPFPGSLALLKLSATVPTPEQSLWMYEQEKQMFRDGAQITLPDATAIADLSYDDVTDKWIAVSATNESEWSGLVRTSATPVPAGSYIKTAAGSGVQLLARSTTNPGVDITMPPTNIKARLKKKAEKSRRNSNAVAVFDFTPVQFTGATLTNGSNIMTASTVAGTPLVGMTITGTGIAAGTTIIGINGTSYYLSANYTGTTGSYTVSQASFVLPVGYTAQSVYSGGVLQREGAAKNYTRTFDGFRETVVFATSPGTSLVQIHGIKQ